MFADLIAGLVELAERLPSEAVNAINRVIELLQGL